jgi:hypothetical protein
MVKSNETYIHLAVIVSRARKVYRFEMGVLIRTLKILLMEST